MANELIMNITPGETRIARLDGGILSELFVEREREQQIVGNIYKGVVTRVLPGMQAAFVDIGLERAAFLYVTDASADLFEEPDDDEDEEEEEAGSEAQRRGPPRRGRRRRGPPPKIEDILKEGQSIIVQVEKEPIRTKGARVTTHVSFPGRYLVFMPGVDHIGVSRRLGSFEERQRLKAILHQHRPAKGGFIARTMSAGAMEESLAAEMNDLSKTWAEIANAQDRVKPPALLHQDLDLVLRSVRDLMSSDIDRLVIDSREEYANVLKFMEQFMPDLASRVQLHDDDIPVFDVYGIETEINRALGKKVWLKSGGYLIVDQSEALTAIDINTGRFVGRDDFEDTILQTNLEAAAEIAYQLRIRNIGGIIVVDFIDMERYGNRQKVFYAFKDHLRRDKVKTTITKISDLGLVEMTRKRTHDSLTQMLSESCHHCHGRGHTKTPLTVAFELFREMKRSAKGLNGGRSVVVRVNPRVAQVLYNETRDRLDALEKSLGKRIIVETAEGIDTEHFEFDAR